MTLNEKSAAMPGDFAHSSSMAAPVLYSFTEVVDEACNKLKDRQIKYSIRRIQAMEDRLTEMEKELDDFLNNRE